MLYPPDTSIYQTDARSICPIRKYNPQPICKLAVRSSAAPCSALRPFLAFQRQSKEESEVDGTQAEKRRSGREDAPSATVQISNFRFRPRLVTVGKMPSASGRSLLERAREMSVAGYVGYYGVPEGGSNNSQEGGKHSISGRLRTPS